jgi:predicted NAD/FAD-dependent oxidoreductase
MDPQWALLLGWQKKKGVCDGDASGAWGGALQELYSQQCAVGSLDLELIARLSSKPGRESASMDCWVAHATPAWSLAHLELAQEEIVERLTAEVELALGPLPGPPDYQSAHRWRYSRTQTALGSPFLSGHAGTLFLGGDWALGPNAEHAFLSGRAIADAICGGLQQGTCDSTE